MIIRKKYIEEIRPFYNSDLIKIITGIRRSGKTYILKTIYNKLSNETNNIVYLDFEDYKTYKKIKNFDNLLKYLEEKIDYTKMSYIF